MSHIPDETLEQYSMQMLAKPNLRVVEEHLLICTECRDRLQTTDEFVVSMKLAAAKIRESGTGQ